MAKKKKKKKKHHADEAFFIEVDRSLDKKYLDLIDEIQFMQADLRREERKARKRQTKKLRKGGELYSTRDVDRRVRQQIIYRMEGTNFIERAISVLNELQPICATIGKLVMSLIVAILSIDSIKYTIKPETLRGMDRVYNVAREVSARFQ